MCKFGTNEYTTENSSTDTGTDLGIRYDIRFSIFLIFGIGTVRFFLAIRGNWVGSGNESIIVNVYGPHNDVSKKEMWSSLNQLLDTTDSSWVLCGDFNEVRYQSDRLNSTFHQSRASIFNEFISRNNLIDILINGKKFTRISDDGTKFSKLDRFLVNNSFLKLWDDLSTVALERKESDHCPIVLRDKIIDFGPKPFKVFDEWFNKEGVDRVVQMAWDKPVRGSHKDCIFRDKLKNVKSELKNWGKNEFGNLDAEIKNLQEVVACWEHKAELGGLSENDRLYWLEARKNWLAKDKTKSHMLKQKARIR
ncbi:uncharacterized protein [Rutidosis leptorrhynchoides]|uniref:uncharacterized protein n=1 Tax=Rutidosis leptorrhynchoides TaxID=125765 RepID=UPI003A9A49F9